MEPKLHVGREMYTSERAMVVILHHHRWCSLLGMATHGTGSHERKRGGGDGGRKKGMGGSDADSLRLVQTRRIDGACSDQIALHAP